MWKTITKGRGACLNCNAGIRIHSIFVFRNSHYVRLDHHGAINACRVLVRRLVTLQGELGQIIVQVFACCPEKGYEFVSLGYRRNVKEHAVGVIKLGKKIQEIQTSQTPHYSSLIRSQYKVRWSLLTFIFEPSDQRRQNHFKIRLFLCSLILEKKNNYLEFCNPI